MKILVVAYSLMDALKPILPGGKVRLSRSAKKANKWESRGIKRYIYSFRAVFRLQSQSVRAPLYPLAVIKKAPEKL